MRVTENSETLQCLITTKSENIIKFGVIHKALRDYNLVYTCRKA